jgi:tetratricopeptide (TPR) repeat protein
MSQLESAQQLMDEAFKCLERFDSGAAEKLGKQLLEMRYSGGFEILALAYEQRGELEQALAVLDQAVAVVPKVWSLWQLLGNMRSDLGDYVGAYEAYDSAAQCPDANVNSVMFNKAVVLHREKRYEECLAILGGLSVDHNRLRAQVLRLTVLNDLERYDDALALSREIEAALKSFDSSANDFNYQNATLEVGMARALRGSGEDDDKVLPHLFRAVEIDRTHARALKLIREIRNVQPEESLLLRLVISGKWFEPVDDSGKVPQFLSTAEVVADNENEALRYAAEFEAPAVRQTLLLDEFTKVAQVERELKGVYRLSGRIFVSGD